GDLLVLAVTALGSARSPLGRGGAIPGDRIVVTGRLGGPALALERWQRGEEPRAEERARFARPMTRLREARWLAARGAHAAVDISDGLASDLGHIASASGVRIVLDAARVPAFPGADWRMATASGEEYEVAMALPAGLQHAELAEQFQAEFQLPLSVIGEVYAGESGVELRLDGERVDLPSGYD